MMNGIKKTDIKQLHEIIVKDIFSNTKEIFNRIDYYTRKYRGNELTDISFFINEENKYIKLFLRRKNNYIIDELNFRGNKLISREIRSNIINDK